jgi:uncharacterized protein (TIGR00369 family)
MKIITHEAIDQELCGRPLAVENGFSRVAMKATNSMVADGSGLIHGGFVFGLADYAAMIAVNHPNVVLGAADVKFLKPVCLDDEVVAEARVEPGQGGKKRQVTVTVMKGNENVFQGVFTCFVLDKHILDQS